MEENFFYGPQMYVNKKSNLCIAGLTGAILAINGLELALALYILVGVFSYGVFLPSIWWLNAIFCTNVALVKSRNMLHDAATVNQDNEKEPIIENSNLINQATTWVWTLSLNPYKIALNMAKKLFISEEFIEKIKKIGKKVIYAFSVCIFIRFAN